MRELFYKWGVEDMKSFEVKLLVKDRKKGEIVEGTYTAEIRMEDSTQFSEILDFMDSVKNIWKKGRSAIKRGSWMELEVVVSAYDNWLSDKPLVQKSFDRWVSVPVEEQDEEGIYLRADTRYTDEHRDMYLSKDIFKDLAFTLG